MTNYIDGKSFIITGAGGGFGQLIAEKAAALGGRIICADIRAEAAEAVAQGIRTAGGAARAIATDVTRIEDMHAAVAACLEDYGSLDFLVNNAGIMPLAFLADHEQALDSWNRCIDINFRGVMNGTIAAYDRMIAQGGGHIVNMSSIYGNHPVVGSAVYGATKAAVNYFSNSVRQEARGVIKVTVVKPAGVPTTGLAASVVNRSGGIGIVGQNIADYSKYVMQEMTGGLPPEMADRENPAYFALKADDIAEATIQAINQPAGVTLSEITVRATGDYYIV